MQCILFSNIGINNMKIFILSLLAIFLIICILYYEYYQIIKLLQSARQQKEHFYNDSVIEESKSDAVNIINDGGNTATSALCDGVDISNEPKNIDTMNTLFAELNNNLNRMTDNVLSYYNLL